MSKQLTKNFSSDEFDCKCLAKGEACSAPSMNLGFVSKLQLIRDSLGGPILVNSGLRCKSYNRDVIGGATRSKHLTGNAADIHVLTEYRRFLILTIAIKAGMTGIGIYGRHMHLDDGHDKLTIWFGKGFPKAERLELSRYIQRLYDIRPLLI